jgi:hypothetical protein
VPENVARQRFEVDDDVGKFRQLGYCFNQSTICSRVQ